MSEHETAIIVFAHYLGIDVETEQDLIEIAEEALDNLPKDWQLGIGDGENAGIPYFYNDATGESSWHHPEEKKYMKIVKLEKKRRQDRKPAVKTVKAVSEQVSRQDSFEDDQGAGSRQQTAKKGDRSGEDQRSKQQQQQQQRKAQKPASRDEDVVEMLDVEDFDEPIQQQKKNVAATTATATPASAAKPSVATAAASETTSAFSLKASDFLEDSMDSMDKPSSPNSNWNKIKEVSKPAAVTQAATTVTAVADQSSLARSKGHNAYAGDGFVEAVPAKGRTGDDRSAHQRAGDGGYSTAKQLDSRRDGGGGQNNGGQLQSVDSFRVDRDAFRSAGAGAGGERERERDGRDTRDAGRVSSPRDHQRDERRDTSAQRGGGGGGRDGTGDRQRDARRGEDDKRSNNTNRLTYEDERSAGRNTSPFRGASTGTGASAMSSSAKAAAASASGGAGRGSSGGGYDEVALQNSYRAGYDDGIKKSYSVTQKLEMDLEDSRQETTRLQQLLRETRSKYDEETESLKKLLRKAEERCTEERDEKKLIEDKLLRLETAHQSQLRDADDQTSSKIRDMTKKIRTEVEAEWKDRIRSAERKQAEDLEEVRVELGVTKKRLDEAQKEIEQQKKRIFASKEDGKLEVSMELEQVKQQLLIVEEAKRSISVELKKAREDYVLQSNKMTHMMQQFQILTAESDMNRIATTNAITEAQSANAALVAATQRIAAMDVDLANLRAEALALRRENEITSQESRKSLQSSTITQDRYHLLELEAKRIKQASTSEINRLNGRVIELEAVHSAMQQQLDKALALESEAIREAQRKTSKAEYNADLLQERLVAAEQQQHKDATKNAQLEKQAQLLEEQLYKQERALKEEMYQAQQVRDRLGSQRLQLERDIEQAKSQIRVLTDEKTELMLQHKAAIDKLQEEVSMKLPSLISGAMQQVELKWSSRLAKELTDCKAQCEVILEQRWRGRVMELQNESNDREAKVQRLLIEEKVETDRLRQIIKQMRYRADEVEDELDRQQYKFLRSKKSMRNVSHVSSRSQRYSMMSRDDYDDDDGDSRREHENEAYDEGGFNKNRRGHGGDEHVEEEKQSPTSYLSSSLPSKLRSAAATAAIGSSSNGPVHHRLPIVVRGNGEVNEQSSIQHLHPTVDMTLQDLNVSMMLQNQLESMRMSLGRFLVPSPTAAQQRLHHQHNQLQHQQQHVTKSLDRGGIGNVDYVYSSQPLSSESHHNHSIQQSVTRSYSDGATAAGSVFVSPPLPTRSTTSYDASQSMLSNCASGRAVTSSLIVADRLLHEGDDRVLFGGVEDSFEAIEDGGYHEGYWKAKYNTSSSSRS